MLSAIAALFAALSLASIGAMAGVFFAFSVAVMPGFDAIKPGEAIRAMQSINRKILNPLFLFVFLAGAIAPLLTGVLLLLNGDGWAGILFVLAAIGYGAGSIGLTMRFNLPMNESLEGIDVGLVTSDASKIWTDYSSSWTYWNSIRALACAGSLLIAGLALFVWGRQGLDRSNASLRQNHVTRRDPPRHSGILRVALFANSLQIHRWTLAGM